MEQKIIAYMRQNNMIEPKEHVMVACSGGADSVCLLLVLQVCSREMDFSLSAIHVEHGIRGEESKEDAEFVKELCGHFGIPLKVCAVDVPQYAKAHKMGLEEAARILRYEQFEKCAAAFGKPVKIALAHHMEDNAETMLFQMARGSGLSGMCGIAPVRRTGDICYIRPFLCVDRGLIEQYLADRDQAYCTDRTNADQSYSRNRIRSVLLPLLTEMNPQAVGHMSKSAQMLSEAYDFIHEQAAAFYEKEVHEDSKSLCVNAKKLLAVHPALMQEVLRMLLFDAAGRKKDIASANIEDLARLMTLQSGRRIALPYGLTAYMEYENLCIGRAGLQEEKVLREYEVTEEMISRCAGSEQFLPLWENADGSSLWGRGIKRTSVQEEIAKKTYTKQFDYDKIRNGFSVRTRKNGDFLVIDREGHRKKLSDYMINEKIPAKQRDHIPLIAQGNEVIWLIGGRIGDNYKIKENTAQIIEIRYNGGMSDGLCNES